MSIPLDTYFNCPASITEALDDLEKLFQITNQKTIDMLLESQRTGKKSGTLADHLKCSAIERLLDEKGKPWENLLRAKTFAGYRLDLLHPSLFQKIPEEHLAELALIIRKGANAWGIIKEWLSPLEKDSVLDAIQDATRVKIGSSTPGCDFQVFDLGPVECTNNSQFLIYDEIFQVTDPATILSSIQKHSSVLTEGLILCVQRKKAISEEDTFSSYKGTFHIFLIKNKKLYSISNSTMRLNLNNKEGKRNPDKYLDRKYDNIWLPINLLFENDINFMSSPSSSLALAIKTENPIISNWNKITEKNPAYKYWIEVFVIRLLEYIKNTPPKTGAFSSDAIKLLPPANPYYTENNNCNYTGVGKYLIEAYGSFLPSLSIPPSLGMHIINTKEHIQQTMAYSQKTFFAKKLQNKVCEDYSLNYIPVLESLRQLIKTQDIKTVIKTALADNTYSVVYFRPWNEQQWETKKEKILKIQDSIHPGIYHSEKKPLLCWITQNLPLTSYNWHAHCEYCSKNKANLLIHLKFIDWRQICEFFALPTEALPMQVIQHLHQQRRQNYSNSILEDIDPLDDISDPWFMAYSSSPKFEIEIPICKACRKKITTQIQRKKANMSNK
jgi:hypothetical protein